MIKYSFIYRDDGAMSTTEISVITSNTTEGGRKMSCDKNVWKSPFSRNFHLLFKLPSLKLFLKFPELSFLCIDYYFIYKCTLVFKKECFTYVSCIYYLLPVNAISVEHFRVGLKSYFSTSKKSLQNIPPHVNVKLYVQHNYKELCV